MKKRTFSPLSLTCLALGCICVMAIMSTLVGAQQPSTSPTATAPPSTLVAVVDLSKVFEAHPTLKVTMDGIQKQLKTAEQEVTTKQRELNARSKELTDLNTTSDTYRRLESDLERKAADLRVQVRQTKTDFIQRQARLYYAAYNEILVAVDKVAEKYGIGLVLRHDSSKIDPKNPQSVAMGMNRPVVLHRNIDITPYVIQELQVVLAQQNNPNRTPRR